MEYEPLLPRTGAYKYWPVRWLHWAFGAACWLMVGVIVASVVVVIALTAYGMADSFITGH